MTSDYTNNEYSLKDVMYLASETVTCTGEPVAEYSCEMKSLPILKLDLSALGSAEGNDVTINVDYEGSLIHIATVKNVKNTPTELYVSVYPFGEPIDYIFSGNGKEVVKNWTLDMGKFYTKTDGNGGSTGEAIVIVPTPKFSVSATRTVEFSRGNLWADATDPANPVFHLEANQWGYTVGEYYSEDEYHDWVQSHVSHFYWSKDARVGCATDYKVANKEYGITPAEDDEFFANTSLSVEGQTGWRTLSRDEWEYLLRDRTPTTTSANFKSLTIGGTSNTVSGLVILPDNSTVALNDITNTDDLAAAGAVFLPAAGYRYGTGVYDVGSDGYYWSSTPDGSGNARGINFHSGNVSMLQGIRNDGKCVRLVR